MKTIVNFQCGVATIILVLLMPPMAVAQKQVKIDSMLNCRECHTCDVPTARKPCLRSCPRPQMIHQSSQHGLSEAPDSMVLDKLANLYQPVYFSHKKHASMATLARDCATCHHFSPAGQIPPCQDCHALEAKTDDLSKPNLKGAYHRQCLSCHREWSHSAKCIACHVPSGREAVSSAGGDPTDIVGKAHPVIEEPTTRIYTTPYKKGPIVTFQHKEHVELFGLLCVDCHSKESCGSCHDVKKDKKLTRPQAEVHAICDGCHADAACDKCHDVKERPKFTHTSTGWPLSSYHNHLDCWSCHPAGRQIGELSRVCVNCHSDWNPGNFRHGVTGLMLDDMHNELDCNACHIEFAYDQDPVCSDCHDDGRTAQTAPPGQRQDP